MTFFNEPLPNDRRNFLPVIPLLFAGATAVGSYAKGKAEQSAAKQLNAQPNPTTRQREVQKTEGKELNQSGQSGSSYATRKTWENKEAKQRKENWGKTEEKSNRNTTTNSASRVNLSLLRSEAEKAGFNPLTALRLTGGQGFHASTQNVKDLFSGVIRTHDLQKTSQVSSTRTADALKSGYQDRAWDKNAHQSTTVHELVRQDPKIYTPVQSTSNIIGGALASGVGAFASKYQTPLQRSNAQYENQILRNEAARSDPNYVPPNSGPVYVGGGGSYSNDNTVYEKNAGMQCYNYPEGQVCVPIGPDLDEMLTGIALRTWAGAKGIAGAIITPNNNVNKPVTGVAPTLPSGSTNPSYPTGTGTHGINPYPPSYYYGQQQADPWGVVRRFSS